MLHGLAPRTTWLVALAALVLVTIETVPRLGPNSPDTKFTLPQYSLGYFWDTPLGWTGLVGGVPVNRDSVQFASLVDFFHDQPAPVPPEDNVYVRFSAYALVGSVLAPVVGAYASFVIVNVLFWTLAVVATYLLALRVTGSRSIAALAALLTSTAPAFAALVGQALPYVASYSLFVLSLLLLDHVRVFEKDTPLRTAAAAGLATGTSLLFYDLYMLPAFVVVYGVLRRTPLRTLAVILIPMALPRVAWSGYWQLAHLPSYSHNEQHPLEALLAWFDIARVGSGVGLIKGYAVLAAHGLLNVATAFLFWPLLLAIVELWHRRRSPEAVWFVAVAIAGFAPALFMLSTWPHIPRWYAYGFPAVYILAAAAALRFAAWTARASSSPPRWQVGLAVALLLPAVLLSNVDVLGLSRPMELLLFQPANWSYLWSR